MTLTPEQFAKIATKKELEEVNGKVDALDEKIDKILTVLDGIAKDVKDIKDEGVTNIAAHDRLQEDINEVRGQVGLEVRHPALNG